MTNWASFHSVSAGRSDRVQAKRHRCLRSLNTVAFLLCKKISCLHCLSMAYTQRRVQQSEWRSVYMVPTKKARQRFLNLLQTNFYSSSYFNARPNTYHLDLAAHGQIYYQSGSLQTVWDRQDTTKWQREREMRVSITETLLFSVFRS